MELLVDLCTSRDCNVSYKQECNGRDAGWEDEELAKSISEAVCAPMELDVGGR